MADKTLTKIVSEADAATLMAHFESMPVPPVGPEHPVILRSKVTLIKDDLPNVGPE